MRFVLDLADLRVGTQQLLALTFANVALGRIDIRRYNQHSHNLIHRNRLVKSRRENDGPEGY